jgi:hypothetical protein
MVWYRHSFSGLVVIALAIGPKVLGFKPGRGKWIIKGDRNHSMTFIEGEVKPSVPSHRILWHVKGPYEYERDVS